LTDAPLHLLLRLDANHHIGLAHAIRVAAILALLETPHRLTVAGDGELLADFFPGARHHPLSGDGKDEFFALVGQAAPDLVLVDHPRPGTGFWQELKAHAGTIPVLAIDDEGGDVDADLIINGTVLDEYHRYPALHASAQVLAGGQYSLIRPVFAESRWQNPASPAVTIVVGSADRARDWALHLVSGKIDLSGWGKVRMIVGRAFPAMATLAERCSRFGIALQSGVSGEEMAQAMASAQTVLITGGMVVYEALAVGVPAVVFPQMENLIPEARWFAQRHCIVDLGFDGGMDEARLSAAVDRLLSSRHERMAMSQAQSAIVDGLGMARAAKAIDSLLAAAGDKHGKLKR
jgi:spore coat polysaccharide biosynthesis predicted glycosyltransferase SpsG